MLLILVFSFKLYIYNKKNDFKTSDSESITTKNLQILTFITLFARSATQICAHYGSHDKYRLNFLITAIVKVCHKFHIP